MNSNKAGQTIETTSTCISSFTFYLAILKTKLSFYFWLCDQHYYLLLYTLIVRFYLTQIITQLHIEVSLHLISFVFSLWESFYVHWDFRKNTMKAWEQTCCCNNLRLFFSVHIFHRIETLQILSHIFFILLEKDYS